MSRSVFGRNPLHWQGGAHTCKKHYDHEHKVAYKALHCSSRWLCNSVEAATAISAGYLTNRALHARKYISRTYPRACHEP